MLPPQSFIRARDWPSLDSAHVNGDEIESDTVFGVICQLPLLREEFEIATLTFHSDSRRRAASRRALPCPSSYNYCYFYYYYYYYGTTLEFNKYSDLNLVGILPKALDVNSAVVFRYKHALVAGDLVHRRHFLLECFAFYQVDILVLLKPRVRLRDYCAAHDNRQVGLYF